MLHYKYGLFQCTRNTVTQKESMSWIAIYCDTDFVGLSLRHFQAFASLFTFARSFWCNIHFLFFHFGCVLNRTWCKLSFRRSLIINIGSSSSNIYTWKLNRKRNLISKASDATSSQPYSRILMKSSEVMSNVDHSSFCQWFITLFI